MIYRIFGRITRTTKNYDSIFPSTYHGSRPRVYGSRPAEAPWFLRQRRAFRRAIKKLARRPTASFALVLVCSVLYLFLFSFLTPKFMSLTAMSHFQHLKQGNIPPEWRVKANKAIETARGMKATSGGPFMGVRVDQGGEEVITAFLERGSQEVVNCRGRGGERVRRR